MDLKLDLDYLEKKAESYRKMEDGYKEEVDDRERVLGKAAAGGRMKWKRCREEGRISGRGKTWMLCLWKGTGGTMDQLPQE